MPKFYFYCTLSIKMTTKDKINKVNEDFYTIIADSFSQTRQYAWDGWNMLLENIPKEVQDDNNLKILDLGCGNGRFAHFLAQNLDTQIDYIGVDSCIELLKLGKEEVKEKQYNNLEYKFVEKNILELENGFLDFVKNNTKFNLITLFGVMHHIYDEKDRQNLFNFASQSLKENGHFVFATWEFAKNQRQLNKKLDLQSPEGQQFLQEYNLELSDFGQDDYTLDWTRINKAYRYCRDYSTEEIENLCKQNSLQITDSFYADGKEGNVNKYYICKKLK